MVDLQDRLGKLTQENEAVAADMEAKTQSLREAERAVAAQQAKLVEHQRQSEESADAHDKVALPASGINVLVPMCNLGMLEWQRGSDMGGALCFSQMPPRHGVPLSQS